MKIRSQFTFLPVDVQMLQHCVYMYNFVVYILEALIWDVSISLFRSISFGFTSFAVVINLYIGILSMMEWFIYNIIFFFVSDNSFSLKTEGPHHIIPQVPGPWLVAYFYLSESLVSFIYNSQGFLLYFVEWTGKTMLL